MEQPYLNYLNTKYRFPRSLVHKPIRRFFQAYLDSSSADGIVLDAGCGSGIDTGPYSDRLYIVGVDYQACYLTHCARAFPSTRLLLADLARLPLGNARIDLILMNQVIEHLADPAPVIAAMSRILVPGGLLVVATPNFAGSLWPLVESTYHRLVAREFDAEENHVTRYTPDLLRSQLALCLRVERLESICANMILVGCARRPA